MLLILFNFFVAFGFYCYAIGWNGGSEETKEIYNKLIAEDYTQLLAKNKSTNALTGAVLILNMLVRKNIIHLEPDGKMVGYNFNHLYLEDVVNDQTKEDE